MTTLGVVVVTNFSHQGYQSIGKTAEHKVHTRTDTQAQLWAHLHAKAIFKPKASTAISRSFGAKRNDEGNVIVKFTGCQKGLLRFLGFLLFK